MSKKILVVDDERQIVKIIKINLLKAGYLVVCAYDGVEALEKVESEKPDMVLLDIMMPRMNGMDVLKRLKANRKTEHIPVVMITAKARQEDIHEGWRGGVSSYLIKPLNLRILLQTVQRIFESIGQI